MTTSEALADALTATIEGIDPALARRWANLYGARAWTMVGKTRSVADLGEPLGQGLYRLEVDYLRRAEWASQVDDILWRRTKLGLSFTPQETDRLRQYLLEPLKGAPRSCDAA